jgi:hypothetical protein
VYLVVRPTLNTPIAFSRQTHSKRNAARPAVPATRPAQRRDLRSTCRPAPLSATRKPAR